MTYTTTKDYTAIASYPTCNFGGLVVLSINQDFSNTVTSGFDFGDGLQGVRTTSIHYTTTGRPYIIRYQKAYYLDEMIRL